MTVNELCTTAIVLPVAGVTAGIDFGLVIVAELFGEEEARSVQSILEYSPEPPFQNGTLEEAGPERLAEARSRRVRMDEKARAEGSSRGSCLAIDGFLTSIIRNILAASLRKKDAQK